MRRSASRWLPSTEPFFFKNLEPEKNCNWAATDFGKRFDRRLESPCNSVVLNLCTAKVFHVFRQYFQHIYCINCVKLCRKNVYVFAVFRSVGRGREGLMQLFGIFSNAELTENSKASQNFIVVFDLRLWRILGGCAYLRKAKNTEAIRCMPPVRLTIT